MRFVDRDERRICIDTSADFKGLPKMKLCYHLRINRNQSNVHIFIPSEALMGGCLYEIRDDYDNDFDVVMVVAISKRGSI